MSQPTTPSPPPPAGFRARRLLPLVEQMRLVHAARGSVRVIDLGGRKQYWIDNLPPGVIEQYRVHFTIVNLPEGYYDLISEPGFECVEADACRLGGLYPENAFDIAHSNSTIEHVGDRERQAAFAREVRRLAPVYHVQAPYFWFPLDPHPMAPFVHWLPRDWVAWALRHFRIGRWPRQANRDRARLLAYDADMPTARWMRKLFPDGELLRERFFGLTKSLVMRRYAKTG